MKAKVTVRLKSGVLDPQGEAIQKGLHSLGFDGVQSVRMGKVFEVELSSSDKSQAQKELSSMSEKLLANTVIEDFDIEVLS